MVNHLTKLLWVNLQSRLNVSESKMKPRNSNSSIFQGLDMYFWEMSQALEKKWAEGLKDFHGDGDKGQTTNLTEESLKKVL